MTPELETAPLEIALGASIDCLRMAEQMLRLHGSTVVADLLKQQADTNMSLLLPFANTMGVTL